MEIKRNEGNIIIVVIFNNIEQEDWQNARNGGYVPW